MDEPKNHLFTEDRHLQCQELVDPLVRDLIDKANMSGWGTIETMEAIDEVMKHLRLAYAEDPDPAEDTNEYVIAINEGHAFIHGR